MELSEKGHRLLGVLVAEIRKQTFDLDHPEKFLGYGETLDLLNLPPDATRGQTDGQTLQFNGLNDLARWIRQHSRRLPRLTGLIVSKHEYDEMDGTFRMANVPGKGYFKEYGKNVEDWTWWLAESRKALDFDWSPYVPADETFEPEEIRHVGAVSEGAQRDVPAKVRQRSQKLRDLARKHFRSPDGKLRCATCDWSKPSFRLAHEIIEIHHTEELSTLPATGRKLTLEEALALLTPLCPTCHRMLHAKSGGGSFTVGELREYLQSHE